MAILLAVNETLLKSKSESKDASENDVEAIVSNVLSKFGVDKFGFTTEEDILAQVGDE